MNDTGAYCVGSLIGRHKLFPHISPGKSWEGSIGGAIVVLAVAYLIFLFDSGQLTHLADAGFRSSGMLTMEQWLGLGLVIVIFGTWGDLVESLLKRTLGVKDSGNILPGHGGMLDRFDSSLLAIPAAVVYLYTLSLF
jgi:phosphatidate cytidylyltransferase